jgi:GNAT superfamily N-acetyltransferase
MKGEDMASQNDDVTIRTDLRPGDIGMVVHLHGRLYAEEYGYGLGFESYVAEGLHELVSRWDPALDRAWLCEHEGSMVGMLFCMHRPGNAAQLRYFLLRPDYRGRGLGKRLMELFMEHVKAAGYGSVSLWTVNELPAAASLYLRHGFTLVEEKPGAAFFNKPLTEQRYELILR